jgi:hypothetical protein
MTALATSKDEHGGAEHGHPHRHGHAHNPERPPGPSDAGTVVLDIGPGVGAAVILTPVEMTDLEIEYRAAGDRWSEKHMAVRERRGGPEVHYAAIFGPLPEGDYEFRVRGSQRVQPELAVTVVEASVTSASWPSAD